MSRIPLIDRSATTADRKALLDQVQQAFGATPNMFKAVANSPAALESMWGAFGALGGQAVLAGVAVGDRDGDLLAQFGVNHAAAQGTEGAPHAFERGR